MAESDFQGKIIAKIKWLRIQPESVKIRYIWISAIVIFAIVVLLWAGIFRKYERSSADGGKNSELIKAGEKLKEDIESKIKIPDIQMPENSPKASPSISPEISPEASVEIIPEAL